MTYSIDTITVTPEVARGWLETKPAHQRRVTSSYVKRLADDMHSGRFTSSPQPFILDTDGNLLDGQHRASAVMLSGIALESAVVVQGVEPEMFGKLDIGQRRTPAQFIDSRNSSLIAAAAKWAIQYQDEHQMNDTNKQYKMTIEEVVDEVEQRPMLELLAGSVALVAKASHVHGPILLAITVLGSASAGDRVGDWLDGLNTGANLEIGDPRLTLRNAFASGYRLLNSGVAGKRRAWAYVLKSWNAFVMDEQLRLLKFRPNRGGGGSISGETLPPIVGA